jgi:hypothetical protein
MLQRPAHACMQCVACVLVPPRRATRRQTNLNTRAHSSGQAVVRTKHAVLFPFISLIQPIMSKCNTHIFLSKINDLLLCPQKWNHAVFRSILKTYKQRKKLIMLNRHCKLATWVECGNNWYKAPTYPYVHLALSIFIMQHHRSIEHRKSSLADTTVWKINNLKVLLRGPIP